jgi:S-adenosylmethionine:tRNA ribosyltransferase-isomerase
MSNKPFYSYELPKERIAQRPVYPYDQAKLLVINRAEKSLESTTFSNIGNYLNKNDLLVFNDSRVIPARFFGQGETGFNCEILLLKKFSENSWEVMARPIKKFKIGSKINFSSGLFAIIREKLTDKSVLLDFDSIEKNKSIEELLLENGKMPIPPYIRDGLSDEQDKIDYQTIFAKNSGSVAAPTASLHFTPQLINTLKEKDLRIETLTLHVGSASFLPITDESQVEINTPGVETFEVSESLNFSIKKTKEANNKVIAVGTTVVRALESFALNLSNETDLFITPGFEFKICDHVVTNFHQPNTTHLALVEALTGRDLLAKAYTYALENDYRFLSYGDGMLIL